MDLADGCTVPTWVALHGIEWWCGGRTAHELRFMFGVWLVDGLAVDETERFAGSLHA